MIRYYVFLLILQSFLITKSHSKSIITRLPGYDGDLPFKLETGYVGIGEKEELKLFYIFVESMRNPKEDPVVFHLAGGPGASGFINLLHGSGPFSLNTDNLTLTLNSDTWTQITSYIYLDIPAGTGFSYAETEQGWISSDTTIAIQAVEFIKKFLINHPKFSRNPVYVSANSYDGLIAPKVTLELYEGIERGDQPPVNIQGYILVSPLTDKFIDFNSRLECAYRMAFISDYIHKAAIDNCYGNYLDINFANLACKNSLQSYEECTRYINFDFILQPYCNESDPTVDCNTYMSTAITKWANKVAVQKALNVQRGKVLKWVVINQTLHYHQGKNDTDYYSYDIFSSISYHKKLSTRKCRALILSGDHDFTFPYVGIEQWIASLNLEVKAPWKPFYTDDQVGGYVTEYARNNYSLTFALVRGAGHTVIFYKPKESLMLAEKWFSSPTYSSDSYMRKR